MFDAFFLTEADASLFTLHWPGRTDRAPVLLLPPLLEELNKSRRQLQDIAMALHRRGHGVLLMDWFGTGDSSGELRDASWSRWQQEVRAARNWLQQHYGQSPMVCALRGGALLLPELADCRAVLLAPVIDGQQQLTQWLRLKLMAARMAGESLSSEQLMAQIQAGGVEIAGYFLSPALVLPMQTVRLVALPAQGVARTIIEPGSASQPGPAMQALVDAWSAAWSAVVGEAFWQTTEISCSAALTAAVVASLAGPEASP